MDIQTEARPLGLIPNYRNLSEEESQRLVFVESYNFSKVRARIIKDGSIQPDKVDQAIVEFRKFASLIALNYKSLAMMNGEVDEVWHALILHTAEYAEFCMKVAGRFIHHQPASEDSPVPDSAKEGFFNAYLEAFGEFAEIWNMKSDCDYAKCDFAGCANCDPQCQ